MKVLLSIKPVFAEQIFNGSKIYEFRRTIFKNRDVNTIIVYASSPVQRVIGEFEIEEIIYDTIQTLWKKTYRHAGISQEDFYKYFVSKDKGYAIKIKKPYRYKRPLSLQRDFKLNPPQFFVYL